MKKRLISLLLALAVMLGMMLPASAAPSFADVDEKAWYAEAVEYMKENGLMDGVGGGNFDPTGKLTRAMMVMVLYRFAGEPEVSGSSTFVDVKRGAWYDKAVTWAQQAKVVEGYSSTAFGALDTLTREQMASILWRYAGEPSVSEESDFSDAAQISGWAKDAVSWAKANQVINGVGGNRFDPKGAANRAQLAQVLMNGIESGVIVKQGAEPTASPEPSSEPDAVTGASQQNPTPAPTPTTEPSPAPTPEKNEKILIAYFSRIGENYSVGFINEGNTAKFAKEIETQLKADGKDVTLFEIVASNPYPSGYEDTKTRATNERNSNARPAFTGSVANFADYDTVFIGYPIWWGDLPMILHTFMESYDFTGKTVIPFNTHEGSGQAGTQSTIANKLSGATVKQGKAIRGSTAQNWSFFGQNAEVKSWLQGLGY